MKYRHFLIFIFCLTGITATAQFPQGFNYQAVLRDGNGDVVADQSATMRFTFHGGSAGGPIRRQEIHIVTTNEFGLVNVTLLTGTVTIAGNINWAGEANYLQVEVSTTGNFVDLGTQQILAVPYAVHAQDAQVASRLAGMELEDPQPGDVITWDGDEEIWVDKPIPSFWPAGVQHYISFPGRSIWHNNGGITEEVFGYQNELTEVSSSVQASLITNGAYATSNCSVPDEDCRFEPKITPVHFPPNAMITTFVLHGSGTVKAKLFRQHVSIPSQVELIASDEPESESPFNEHIVNNISFAYFIVVEPLYLSESTDIGIVFTTDFTIDALQIGYMIPSP